MKMETVISTDKLDVSETVYNKDVKKKVTVPFTELIEKFHKIKAGRKLKDRHSIVCAHMKTDSEVGRKFDEKSDTDCDNERADNDVDKTRPSSARAETCERLKTAIGTSRRMSLPSIFRPASITPSSGNVPIDGCEKKQHVHVGISCGLSKRRFSLPYVIKEYAKHDLNELESELPGYRNRNEPYDAKKSGTNDQTRGRGINGKELHAFYNLWETQHRPVKKPLPRRLGALLHADEKRNIDSEGRPRVFSL